MSKIKLQKPLLLMEEYSQGEISRPQENTAPAVQTDVKTISVDKTAAANKVRSEIVKDVESILTNLEALSKQIKESIDKDFFTQDLQLNESLDSVIDFVKKQANFVKGMALLKGKYESLSREANADIISAKEYDAIKKLDAKIDKMKRARDEASGPKKDAIQQKAIATINKLKEQKASVDSKFEEAKEKARQSLEEIEDKMKKYEGNMPGGTEGELYDMTKKRINNKVKLEGLQEKGRIAKEKGDADAKKEAADELKKIGIKSKETQDAIKELSKDVDPKLEEQIKKIEDEISREKDEDLAKIQSDIKDLQDSLSGDELDNVTRRKKEEQLNNLKKAEDKTLEGIYYLEDYLEDLKAERAALKGEDYDKKESKVGSTEDDKEGSDPVSPEKEESEESEDGEESNPIDKLEQSLDKAEAKLSKDKEKEDSLKKEIEDKKEKKEELKKELDKIQEESLEESDASDDSDKLKAAKKVQLDEVEKEIKKAEKQQKKLKDVVIPKDNENVEAIKKKIKDIKDKEVLGVTTDDIKKKKKAQFSSESKELDWESLKEDLGINQEKPKIHESFSIADKFRMLLR